MSTAQLRLNKNQDRRLRFGHCWIYSNEVDTKATPLKGVEPGQAVDIVNHQGKWLGSGYVNPHSLICARLVSRDREHPLTGSLLVHRLKIALSLRERMHTKPYYRLVFGESDGLPGLVVDRYGDLIVAQITTAGMERMKAEVVAAIEKVLKPVGILLRNDSSIRGQEGLDQYIELAAGKVPELLTLEEGGLKFQVQAQEGQKTGWFFDQADNRARMARYIRGGRVLDVCSYVGAWGVQAAAMGAEEVVCVDSSAGALEMVQANAALNDMSNKVSTKRANAFDALRDLRSEREHFDLIVLDPPAFIKRRKDTKEGTLAYKRLNQAAMQLLSKDGILITSSCSHHMSQENLLQLVQQAGRHNDRFVQLLEQGQQATDHPIHPAIPETAYLKSFYLRVLPAF
ncbi:MAG: class I SAM-dependent rRNA methyltransferase [Gammaproteobacteria bacterium]|nr:class I SAM-dependent rRNA methyltransferase [Gammaproteobacteria bacterium]